MYDKVRLWVEAPPAGWSLERFRELLERAGGHEFDTGEVSVSGRLRGLSVRARPNGVSIMGSLPKFHHGTNLRTLDTRAAGLAVEEIGDALRLDVKAARVTELEFGANLELSRPVGDYLPMLGDYPYLKRDMSFGTLYYKGKGKGQSVNLVIYDKVAQCLESGDLYDHEVAGLNIGRYEMRLYKDIAKGTGCGSLTAGMLGQRATMQHYAARWLEYYERINKLQKQMREYSKEQIRNVGDAVDLFVLQKIGRISTEEVAAFVEGLKAEGTFTDPKCYSRAKAKLNSLAERAAEGVGVELIKELDTKVRDAASAV